MSRAYDPKPDKVAVAQLVHLHADLGAKLIARRLEADRIAADMRHVEAVIRMFDPGHDVRRIAVKRRNAKRGPFKRGTVFRSALAVLRDAAAPMTTKEICLRLLAAKSIAEPTREQVRDMIGAVHRSIRNQEGESVERIGEGMPARWQLSNEEAAN